MNVIRRVKGILLDPDTEWSRIEQEPGEPAALFGYIAILASIPALAGFIGTSVIGVSVSVGTFRVPFLPGLLNAFIGYCFSFVVVYLVALIIDALAPFYRARRHFPSALKLAAYSFTPSWLAGIFLLFPGLRFLAAFGLYGFFLLWTGLPVLMRARRDQSLLYAVAVLCCALAVIFALALLQAAIGVQIGAV